LSSALKRRLSVVFSPQEAVQFCKACAGPGGRFSGDGSLTVFSGTVTVRLIILLHCLQKSRGGLIRAIYDLQAVHIQNIDSNVIFRLELAEENPDCSKAVCLGQVSRVQGIEKDDGCPPVGCARDVCIVAVLAGREGTSCSD